MRGPFENALGNAKLALLAGFIYSVLVTIITIILAVALAMTPSSLKVEQVNADGSVNIKIPGQHLPGFIEGFAAMKWVTLTSWPENGAVDAIKAVKEQKIYLTPRFIQQYEAMLKQLNKDNYLENYVVSTIAIQGDPSKNVEKVAGGWEVKLTFISRFYYNPPSKDNAYSSSGGIDSMSADQLRAERVFKQIIIFKVVTYPNPMGFGLDEIMAVKTDDNYFNGKDSSASDAVANGGNAS
jgi:hypothetical protein